MITVSYVFAEAYSTFTNNLDKEIMALLPDSYEESNNIDHIPVDLETDKVGKYEFEGWNPFVDHETGDITYQGIWISPDSRWKKSATKGLLRAGASALFSFDGAWDVPNSVGYTGSSRFMLNGEQAYCIDPDVHMDNSYIGASYSVSGSVGGDLARIAVMGTYNGVSPGSIQAAIWNAIKGTSAGGDDCQPGYWAYDSTGWRIPSCDCYSSGSLQRLMTNIGSPVPDTGKLNLKKVSSDSNYAYGTYTNNYSLAGAVYGVYTDPACTDQAYTLVTDSNGNSNTLVFSNDVTLYIKETTPSKGFALDASIYTARITRGRTTTITSQENPYNDPVRIVLVKQNARSSERAKYLDEAEFTVRYYDTQENELTGLEAKNTWVFKAIYNADGEAEVIMDSEHYVAGDSLPLNDAGMFYLPLGTFTIQESKAPQTYAADPNVYIGHIYRENDQTITVVNESGFLTVENEKLTQSEREVIISTTAVFEENGEHRYVADGVAHIVDTVEYDFLVPGQTYRMKAKLMQVNVEEVLWTQEDYENGECEEDNVGTVRSRTRTEGDLVMEAETTFVPEEESGTVDVRFDGIDLDDKANTDYVVYEYLYLLDTEPVIDEVTGEPSGEITVTGEEEITYHEDINDEGQSVHVDELYRAAFVLYKISEGNRNRKLSGAYFTITTHRVKRDGREVDRDLGVYVTGGIYISAEEGEELTVKLYRKPSSTTDPETGEEVLPDSIEPEFIGEYMSSLNSKTRQNAVMILGLEDGIYFTQVGNEEMVTWYIAEGTIYLPKQEEDTEITFAEIAAPEGYVRDSKPFVMNLGHDYTVDRVENYRSNYFPYVPVTGRDI